MNRRMMLGALAAGSALPRLAAADNRLRLQTRRLNLKHTWTTVMSSSDFRDTLFVEYSKDGTTGLGEGAPIVRYHESAETCTQALESIRPFLEACDPWQYRKVLAEVFAKIPGNWAAKAGLDIALLDWVSQRAGVPLWQFLGLDRRDAAITTMAIGIDKADIVRQKVREAADFPVLKVKVGLANDEEMIAAVRAETKKPIRADANEGFKSKEEAVEKINWLEKQGVEFIEQPLPAENLEEMNWIRKRVHMPILADEACLRPADIVKVAPYFDGVNIKIDKCGGLLAGLNMISLARSLNLKVMLGCMVSSSVAITAAAQLTPLVDYADLDGFLLISNDPYEGVKVDKGKLILPDAPGLGLKAKSPGVA